MNAEDFDREFHVEAVKRLEAMIDKVAKENAELLERFENG